jgi:DNA-binding response OmpR family regulator
MWVLVVSNQKWADRADGAVQTLGQLGCEVRTIDFWDSLEDAEWISKPPQVIVIEALDEVDAGRLACTRVRGVEALAEIPVLMAVSVGGVPRMHRDDAFEDFILVPYVPAELYTRIRRLEWKDSEFANAERIKFGAVCVDLAAHEVTVDGRAVTLTQQEFALLRFLAQHRGRVFSREQLLSRVWGVAHYGSSRTVDIHVQRLRTKLGEDGALIETVRGVGYKMRSH